MYGHWVAETKLNLRFVERRQTRALSLSLTVSLPILKQKISGGAPIPTSPEPFHLSPPPDLIFGSYTCLMSVPIYPRLPRFPLSTVPFHHCLRCTVSTSMPSISPLLLPFRPPLSKDKNPERSEEEVRRKDRKNSKDPVNVWRYSHKGT